MSTPADDDLEQLIRSVAARHKSRADYAVVSDRELIARMAMLESFARQIVVDVIDTGEADWTRVYHRAALIGYKLTSPSTLAQLRELGADTATLQSLVHFGLELKAIYAEFSVRLSKVEVGRQMLQIGKRPQRDQPAASLRPLLEMLRVERIISFRPEKDDSEDLQAIAMVAAWEKFQKLCDREIARLSLPERVDHPSPPGIRVRSAAAGGWNWGALRAAELHEAQRLYLPVLRGQVESLPAKVRQVLRDQFAKRKAKKRAAPEVPFDDQRDAATSPGESMDTSIRRDDAAYRVAGDHWKERGRRFVEARYAGKTVLDASKAAGVSRVTGQKYIRELRRLGFFKRK